MYYDHYQVTEPATIDSQEPTAVYAAKQLPDGTWHCLLTEAQWKRRGAQYKPFSKAPSASKGGGVSGKLVDGEIVKEGYPLGAPVHVYGTEVREPGKVYRPGSKDPIIAEEPDAKALEAVERGQ